MAAFPSIRPQPPTPNFNYPPPGFSPYSAPNPSGFPSSYHPASPSYPGSLGRPMIPVPSIGPTLPISFQPPPLPSYTFIPPTRPPSFSPPSFRPSPSFDSSAFSGRVERFSPPATSGPSSWATPSLPPHLSPSYPSISSLTGSSPSAYSLNPTSLRAPSPLTVVPLHPSSFSLPSSLLTRPSFSQPPSLSGRAHYVSPFTSSSQGVWSPRNQEIAVSTPYSFSRSPFPSETLGKVPRNSSFSFQDGSFFAHVEDHLQFQKSIQMKFEKTMQILYNMDPSPERPFPVWGTVGVSQFIVQVNPRTTMLIDPVAVTEFFQRASEAQRWAVQAQLVQFMKRREVHDPSKTWIERLDHKAHELGVTAQSKLAHALWEGIAFPGKIIIAVADAVLKISKPMMPDSAIQNIPQLAATAQKSIEIGHQKIDALYGTNFASRYDPLNQRMQFVQAEAPGGGLFGKVALVEKLELAANLQKAANAAGALTRQTAVIEETLLTSRQVTAAEKASSVEARVSGITQKIITDTSMPTGVNLLAENVKMINSYLGEGTSLITNKAGDFVFLSKDGLRRVRFDFIRPDPHLNPHMHVEYFINGQWKGSGQIYPFDVPHK